MKSVGVSWLLDLEGIPDHSYHNQDVLNGILHQAAAIGNLDILESGQHQFRQQKTDESKNGGCTIFLLLAESHLSAHTWPEYNKIVIDLFSCGSLEDGQRVIDFLVEAIPHQNYSRQKIERGINP